MSNWKDIIQKNTKQIEKKVTTQVTFEEDTIPQYNLLNLDEEFDRVYSLVIDDIHYEFAEFIRKEYLPFMNRSNMTGKYLFTNYLKYHSKNYYDLKDKIDKENEEIIKQEEADEKAYIEELNEYDNHK